jgi:antitoxin component YwqK of YwqJK toxin-antitoxin module
MKTFKTLILMSSLAGTAAFAQPVDCPEGTKLFNDEGVVFYCSKSGERGIDTTPYVALHPNGKAHAKGQFVNGKREGRWEYRDEEGRLTGVTHFQNDQFDGKRIFYDEAGNVKEEQNWQAGNREGEQVKFEKGERKVRQFKADRLVRN